ncbi:MAG: TonB-dependent receptor, partial [Bacteroidetes bacterium]
MKHVSFLVALATPFFLQAQKNAVPTDSVRILMPLEIVGVRATDKQPFTKTNITKTQIELLNTGQDIPFVLNQTPGVVAHSDAGNGIGYTGLRIRGT